jgi:hypothetical protein
VVVAGNAKGEPRGLVGAVPHSGRHCSGIAPGVSGRLVAPDAEMPVALREAIGRSERRNGVQRSERLEQRDGLQRKDKAKRRSSWGEGSSARNFSPAGGFAILASTRADGIRVRTFTITVFVSRIGVTASGPIITTPLTCTLTFVRQPERSRFG